MGKVSGVVALGVLMCVIDLSLGMGTYYLTYPNTQYPNVPYPSAPAALAYPSPYDTFSPYAFVPLDCDKDQEAGNMESSSNSESSESSEESKSENSSESSSSSEESGESDSKKESSSESDSSNESSSEGDSSSDSDSSSESSESKEGDSNEGKKKKGKKVTTIYGPFKYTFPPRQPIQRYVYSPTSFLPYRAAFSMISPQMSYPIKSTTYPYYSSTYTVPPTTYVAPVKGFPPASVAPVARVMSNTLTKYVAPMTYPLSSLNSYPFWGPNPYYYKK